MTSILTVTLSPCVDLATSVSEVVAGPKLRCNAPRIDPGGGGVNVARAIKKLGGTARALVVVGGPTGEQLLSLIEAEAIPFHAVRVKGSTRQSFAVTDDTTGAQYRFSLPAVALQQEEAQSVMDEIYAATESEGLVVLSGSVAPGLPDNFPSLLLDLIAPKTDRLILDTSGPALDAAVSAPKRPLYLLRIDQKEASEAAGTPLETVDDAAAFARSLVARGAAQIVVTGLGAAGSILATSQQTIFCTAPNVPVLSKIGAGDAFVGALTLALSRNNPLEQALQWGVASASATVMTEGTALCKADDFKRLLSHCATRVL